jgi:uncharacterized protein YjiS (DUF1127 family)
MSSLTHTHYTASHPATEALPLRKWFAAIAAAFRQRRERARLIAELSGLDDRELADFRMQRSDIVALADGYRVPAMERQRQRR